MNNPFRHSGVWLWLAIPFGVFLTNACGDPPTAAPLPLDPPQPAGFVAMEVPEDNPLTAAGVALGEKLFFDPGLSADGTVSCATCHQPRRALTDGRAVAVGLAGREGIRNTPSLFNVGFFYRGLFWDGRVQTLEEQVLHPLANPREMGGNWPDIEQHLNGRADYREGFAAAFGQKDPVSMGNLSRALGQYLRTLVSAESRFDKVMRGEEQFTPAEQRGWAIFFDATDSLPHAECAHCHSDPLFTTLEFHNIGLDPEGATRDAGRIAVTGRSSDQARFRVPALRNVALTAPYMHDGRFGTLEEVLDHYNQGGSTAFNVSPNVRPLGLNDGHIADLIAFLNTLTDSTIVSLPRPGNGQPKSLTDR